MGEPPRANRNTCVGAVVGKAAITLKVRAIRQQEKRKSFAPIVREAASEGFHGSSAFRETR
jgi:hypothetical protein